MIRQIVIRQVDRPGSPEDEEEIHWFFHSFGIGEGRDTDRVATQVVITLLEHQPRNEGLPVERIASDLGITQSRVNHHIRNLIDAGILYRHRKLIYLRGSTLRSMVQELRKDALRMFDDLEEVAEDIDKEYGLGNGRSN
ncbi:MAG: winged helix-turn-helix transcriptional regulator [Methanoregula sp.]|jgi:predicted transcriptional regulator